MSAADLLRSCTGFEWDEGNAGKNWRQHRVADGECEQVFFNRPLVARHDEQPSLEESRFLLLGVTDLGRKLFLACTIRGDRIRVISARDMTRREREAFYTYG